MRQVQEPWGGLGAEGAQVQVQVEGLPLRHVHLDRAAAGGHGQAGGSVGPSLPLFALSLFCPGRKQNLLTEN